MIVTIIYASITIWYACEQMVESKWNKQLKNHKDKDQPLPIGFAMAEYTKNFAVCSGNKAMDEIAWKKHSNNKWRD